MSAPRSSNALNYSAIMFLVKSLFFGWLQMNMTFLNLGISVMYANEQFGTANTGPFTLEKKIQKHFESH